MPTEYNVYRHYSNLLLEKELVADKLTLEQARAMCKDSEASSSSCSDPENIEITDMMGSWFLGYDED